MFYVYPCGNVWQLTEDMCHHTHAVEGVGRECWDRWVQRRRKSLIASPKRCFLRGKTFNRRPPTTSLVSLINVHGRRQCRLAPRERSAAAEAEAARPRCFIETAVTTENNVFTTAWQRSSVAIILMGAVKIESRGGSLAFNAPPALQPLQKGWTSWGGGGMWARRSFYCSRIYDINTITVVLGYIPTRAHMQAHTTYI